MMSEGYLYDEDYGMELQSLDSNEGIDFPRERIVLTPPREWLDPRKPLPTDKEFHRWISEQLRAHRNGGIVLPQRQRQAETAGADDASCASDSSQLSGIGRAIQSISSNIVAGVLRKRHNATTAANMERQTLLDDDCFSSRDAGVVGMELSVLS